MSGVYTMPPGAPFGDSLARHVLGQSANPTNLSDIQILLPTRRGVRHLQERFLHHSKDQALLLPRLQTFGDIDEEELTISLAGQGLAQEIAALPPAMPSVRRRILLARLIMGLETYSQGFDSALKLADALGAFMDQIYIEELDLSALPDLVDDAGLAEHWQITLKFLNILSESWPKILAEHSMIDGADRRSRLLHLLAGHWQAVPPSHHIIAAGSTGTVPATARLLSVIAGLPNGHVIIPGLDQMMSQQAWDSIAPSHPQYVLKQLLTKLDCPRGDVKIWGSNEETYSTHTARQHLMSLMMLPAENSGDWQDLRTDHKTQDMIRQSLDNLSCLACGSPEEEALTIALALRETLETPDKTAALVTPDRLLARRVAAILKRWDITIDDSAGQSLIHQPSGLFLRLISETALNGFAPASVLALFKHALCHLDSGNDKASLLAGLEEHLRGVAPPPGLDGLKKHFADKPELLALITELGKAFDPLCDILKDETVAFDDMLGAHIQTAENLAGAETLWSGADGQEAANFIADAASHCAAIGMLNPADYHASFTELLSAVTLRPAFGTHPRLQILGQLEARLVHSDLIILGGLNEGVWPADSGYDPWMSRPMRVDFGLPDTDRMVGLAAHDFCQAFCAPDVLMTRAKRSGGSVTVPSRWLTRLETVLQAAGLRNDDLKAVPYQNWAQHIDHADTLTLLQRPAPTPPLSARPKELYATKIEQWLQDPYSIYARYILGLKPLEPLEKPIDAAETGRLLHAVLERAAPLTGAGNPFQHLQETARSVIAEFHMEGRLPGFWWPRFERLCRFLIRHEQDWSGDFQLCATEAKGSLRLEGVDFTLSAIADRIDSRKDGSYALIDYKSGGTYSAGKIKSGALPQLPLEALILNGGGFDEIGNGAVSALSYWVLNGGQKAGTITTLHDDLEGSLQDIQTKLEGLITQFSSSKTPYLSIPRSAHIPRFNDYTHLARIKEWSAQDDAQEAA